MVEERKRHCWECLRRSLVCDFTRPQCTRCSTAGVACPGYGATEPRRLKWLPPGKVTSRRQKKPVEHEVKGTGCSRGLARELPTDLHVFVQATEYYNACIYPDLRHIATLGRNTAIYPITPEIVQMAMARHPDHIRMVIVCMTLSHRMNRLRNEPGSQALVRDFFRYRGQLIRSLSDDIQAPERRTSDLVVAGMLTLLLVDAQQGASPHWRCHLDGVRKIIDLRGGICVMARSPGLRPLLLFVVFAAIMGDTSSPSSQLSLATSDMRALVVMITKHADHPFAFGTYPAALFREILNINYLRVKALEGASGDLIQSAFEILARIHSFCVAQWAQSISTNSDWELLGAIHQDAIAIYCIFSLQSLGVLPWNTQLGDLRTSHAHSLQQGLTAAVSSPCLKRFVGWDLVVLGVAAVKDTRLQAFLRHQLPCLSYSMGTHVPLLAKGLLEKFWALKSTHKTWDQCFDQPYTFAMHMSVDVSGVR
ncbi:hypothetical protein P170DRAFT_455556 [Aspergillus steynii IBT 23096]|uniref:Uncharacterized protein n=1 Tax=Aspergillus steynii IBT 23096 TaxID=1392250 RepID=A0A2I2GET6_9EURO|nr:uncharacterized protein P170DRAFT_455556 [Aspergillus steynii IBT 23096]PLB51393.1 hypothetical protein P170DRAFT_455556 [Aspergillus steynii IBT 23096]